MKNQKTHQKNKIPTRTCCGCRETFPKKDLIRVVRKTDGEADIDFTGRMNGRGAYICKNAECFRKARKSGSIARSLDMKITDDIYERLEKELIEFEA